MTLVAETFSELSLAAKVAIVGAIVFAAAGLLAGLAGLLLCGMLLSDALFPGAGGPVDASMVAVVANFVVMAAIALLGFLNLSLALKWEVFLGGGWKRYLAQSALCALAAGFGLTSISNAFL